MVTSSSLSKRKSIAVLPLIDMSPGKTEEYFCDGLTEEIIHALSKIQELKVTSRASAFTSKTATFQSEKSGSNLK